jgi:hypothetical protein
MRRNQATICDSVNLDFLMTSPVPGEPAIYLYPRRESLRPRYGNTTTERPIFPSGGRRRIRSGITSWTWKPSHCGREYECPHERGYDSSLRKLGGPPLLPWKNGRRDYSGIVDVGSYGATEEPGEKGTTPRPHGFHPNHWPRVGTDPVAFFSGLLER